MSDFTICQGGQMYNVYYEPNRDIKEDLQYTKDIVQFYRDCGFLVVGI